MDRVSTIAGSVVGLALLVGLLSLIPPGSCRDGWDSPSIGRQGACSHHGGVKRHGDLAFLALAASVGAGLLTSVKLAAIAERRRKAQFKRNLVPPAPDAPIDAIVLYAILSESKVEFMYKGQKDFVPTLRVVTPTALSVTHGPYGNPGVPCLIGYCHTREARRTFVVQRISRPKLLGA